MTRSAHQLPAYALFASLLAAAGLPIYIHAPKFFVDEYGVSLGALGTVLFALLLLDVVQDPLLGRLSQALRHRRGAAVAAPPLRRSFPVSLGGLLSAAGGKMKKKRKLKKTG